MLSRLAGARWCSSGAAASSVLLSRLAGRSDGRVCTKGRGSRLLWSQSSRTAECEVAESRLCCCLWNYGAAYGNLELELEPKWLQTIGLDKFCE